MQYPRRLNNICKFEEGSRIYLADLDRKVVVQIGEIASEILDLCSDMNLDQIVEKLQDKYGRHQIHKELEALEELGEMGLFFADEYIKQTNGKDKILVINSDQEFIKPRHPLGNPIDAFNNYYLLKALTELVELRFASVDSDTEQEVRNLIDTGDESFRLVKLPLYKQGRYMVEHYTGVLSLSTVPYLEMPLYRNSSVPVVALLYSTVPDDTDLLLKGVLYKYAATRPFDALVVDAPWQSTFFRGHGFHLDQIYTIPVGIDINRFRRIQEAICKDALARFFGTDLMKSTSVIGIVIGEQTCSSYRSCCHLAELIPDNEFVVMFCGQAYEDPMSSSPANLHFYQIRTLEDVESLAFFLSGLELLVFFTTLGSSFFLLLTAMACELPVLLVSDIRFSKELEGFGSLLLPVQHIYTTSSVRLLAQEVERVLSAPQMLRTLGVKLRRQASLYSWGKTAEKIVSLFQKLMSLQIEYEKKTSRQKILFYLHYEKGTGITEPRSMHIPSLTDLSMERGIALSLLESGHTIQEVRHLFDSLLGQEATQQIMEALLLGKARV